MNRSTLLIIIIGAIAALAASLASVSCSTTRRLPEGELLYTGVKGVDITPAKGPGALPGAIADEVKQAVAVKPNNALFGSASVRYPFPLGLWVYNNWPDSTHGLRKWLYDKLAATPVTVTDVRPAARVKMIDQMLANDGYFRAYSSYELIHGKNPRKASILYKVIPGPGYPIDTLMLPPDTSHVAHVIDSVARKIRGIAAGTRYCVDSLSAARAHIANTLRNRGYYFFRPEYIEYLADSTIRPRSVALKMTLADNIPTFAMARYRVGKVTTRIFRHDGGGTPDTLETPRLDIIEMQPMRMRESIITDNVTFRPGRYFAVREMDRTQSFLSRLGIFNAIDIEVIPDTADNMASRLLNVDVACTLDRPLEASIEVNASSKSNSYLGPGLVFGVTNRNVFGGGEQLNVSISGSYEWQTGRGASNVFNSYELGLGASLAFPRLLAPKFIPRSRRSLNWTRIALGANLLNRPHYFKMAQFNASINYDWKATRHVTNTFTLFKLTYTKLMHTTPAFDSIMNANLAIAQSFQSQFIPQMMFTYTFDRALNFHNTLNWTFTLQQAGNLFWSIYELCGKHGEKRLFRTPLAQFVKSSTQLVWGHRLGMEDHWLVSRVKVGAAHAYGNSKSVPYAEQFYCGGANSVRAFTVRSLGPGSYRAPKGTPDDYFDQTGTFLFEANVEYRFPILGPLHGAVFLDSGNVWLLKSDPQRPGGLLKASTFFKDLALGTGAGLRFDIGMLVLRGDLGIGIHAPYDTGKKGYYNMKSFGKSLAFHLAIGYPF